VLFLVAGQTQNVDVTMSDEIKIASGTI